jgi:hypothetical protein
MPIYEYKGNAIEVSSWEDSDYWYANAVMPLPEGGPFVIPADKIGQAGFATQQEAERKALEVAKSWIDRALV